MLFDDLVRVQTAITFLRPIAEGLASFAEFDAVSKHKSLTQSTLMTWVMLLFVDPREIVKLAEKNISFEMAFSSKLAERIAALRMDQDTLKRKTRVLLRPFKTVGGGYLPGYLMVKSVRRRASIGCSRFVNETDLFFNVYDEFFL